METLSKKNFIEALSNQQDINSEKVNAFDLLYGKRQIGTKIKINTIKVAFRIGA